MERLTLQELAKYLDHVIEIDYDFKAETDFAKNMVWHAVRLRRTMLLILKICLTALMYL